MKPINIPRRKLRSLYLGKRLTVVEIGKIYNCSDETIRNYLIKYDIKRRRDSPRYILNVKIPRAKTKLSYLAGIVDGEGTISLVKSTHSICGYTPLLSIVNTDNKLLDWLKLIGGKNSIKKPEKIGYRVGFRWYNYSVLDTYKLIKAIYPYLIIKKDKAKKVMEFCEIRLSIDKNNSNKKIDRTKLNTLIKYFTHGRDRNE